MAATGYAIRVRGVLDPGWSSWFEGMEVRSDRPGESVIAGPVADQAALHGLLEKIRDRAAVVAAVRGVAPDAVVNMLTAIPARLNPRPMPAEFALTNRLRTEGTRNLLDAAAQSGVRRIIAQGLAFAYEPGDGPADEETPLWPRPPAAFASSLTALRELEAMTTRPRPRRLPDTH